MRLVPTLVGLLCALPTGCCLDTGSIGSFPTTGAGVGASSTGARDTSATGSITGYGTSGSAASGTTGGGLSAGAPCDSNSACLSDVCGANGSGHCCLEACGEVSPPCGATDCNSDGACTFPDRSVTCGSASCSGNTLIGAGACDGTGHCGGGASLNCAPFACTPSGCAPGCASDGGCASQGFCDGLNQVCCNEIASQVYVDSVGGDDATPCCGSSLQAACQTLGQALRLIDSAGAVRETLQVTVDGGGGDWSPPGETYPVVMGWNVTLNAPGVYFLDPSPSDEAIFKIAPLSPSDLGNWVAITGGPVSHIGVGMNQAQSVQSASRSAISVAAGETLYIANATVDGVYAYDSTAIDVAAGGGLTLGRDATAAVRGEVDIGTPSLWGSTGIGCHSDGVSRGCVIDDAPVSGHSSVWIQNQLRALYVEDFSIVSLSGGPVIGATPEQPGFLQCPSSALVQGPVVTEGVVVTGNAATLSFSNGTVQCIQGNGFRVETPAPGRTLTALSISNTLIQNTVTAIQQVNGGAIDLAGSVLRYNGIGVIGVSDGIDLSGEGLGKRNTIVCSSTVELQPDERSIGVWNTGSGTIDARNVDWDSSGPDLFLCTSSECSCQLKSCSKTYGSDGMDIVEAEAGTVRTTGNGLSSYKCTVPAAPDAGGL